MFMLIHSILLFIVLSTVVSWRSNIGFVSPSRTILCLPINALIPGTQSTRDYGKTKTACANFVCMPGYNPSGATCIVGTITQNCTPTNGNSPGTQTSTDGGVTFTPCSGFSCNSGYNPSGATCLASVNVYCAMFTQGINNACWRSSDGTTALWGGDSTAGTSRTSWSCSSTIYNAFTTNQNAAPPSYWFGLCTPESFCFSEIPSYYRGNASYGARFTNFNANCVQL